MYVMQCRERLTRGANSGQFEINWETRRGGDGEVKESLIYRSDYFICINESRVLHIISIENIIFHVSDNFVSVVCKLSSHPPLLLLSTDVK